MFSFRLPIALFGTAVFPIAALSLQLQCNWPTGSQHILEDTRPLCQASIPEPEAAPKYYHSTWSHPPLCVSGPQRQYCTHTTFNFRNRTGLSIIASPAAAEAATRAFDFAQKAPTYPSDGLKIQSIPDKGKGLITTRPIKKGEVIMLDSPAIIASAQLPSHMTHPDALQLLTHAVERLPKADEKAVLALDTSSFGTVIQDVMKTNAFACQIDDGGVGDGYLCLFPSVSRINHACQPNAHAKFIPRTLLMEVKAMRDIKPGEEISITYRQIDMKYAERQKLYEDAWGFTCKCDLCTASSYARKGSDQRRERFGQLRKNLNEITAETYDAQQVLAWEMEVFELSEREGLEVLVAEDLERTAYVYSGLGLIEEAKVWARRARDSLVEWTAVDGGPNNELKRVQELLVELGDVSV